MLVRILEADFDGAGKTASIKNGETKEKGLGEASRNGMLRAYFKKFSSDSCSSKKGTILDVLLWPVLYLRLVWSLPQRAI